MSGRPRRESGRELADCVGQCVAAKPSSVAASHHEGSLTSAGSIRLSDYGVNDLLARCVVSTAHAASYES